MKSILIIQPWISYRGAESVSIEEAKNYKRQGIKTSILCAFVDWERIKKEDRKLNYIISPHWMPIFISIPYLFVLLLKNGKKYEVLNPHNFPTLWIAASANIFLHKKIVWRVHNFPQVWFKNQSLNSFWKWISFPVDNWAAHRTNEIWVVSEKVGGQVKKFYNLESKVVYPVIDNEYFAKKRNVKKDFDLILIPAKITPAKSFDLAVNVIKKVNKVRPKTKWVIAGEGNLKSVPKNVVMAGWQSKDKLAGWYQKASLIFLPGYWGEGFNVVVLEGLAAGTPSLIIKGSGAENFIEKNKSGIVCNPNAAEIANSIVRFLNK